MSQLVQGSRAASGSPANLDKAVRILAKSLFRQLKDSGYEHRDILTLSSELVGLITTDLRPAP